MPQPSFSSPGDKPHVVILGGGFGGLYAARALATAPVRVTLIDRRNHHLFQPLLYQVATAALNPSDIASPIRRILRHQANVTVLLGQVDAIDTAAKRVRLTDGEVSYDYLILATGATHAYFGHEEWAPSAPGLKTIEDALEIRRRVLLAYEAAEREADSTLRREWLTFLIIGAGPTGVELAGALAEISRHALARDFRNIDATQARVLLVEGKDRVLPTFPADLSEKAEAQLARLGVEVRKNTQVTRIDTRGAHVGGERIPARTILWAAGVSASPVARSLGAPLDRVGRVLVHEDLTIPGRSDVFVIGDLSSFVQDGNPLPGLAPVAMQQGRHAAANLLRSIQQLPLLPFRYVHRGSLATIGRAAAVADLGGVHLSGLLAWTFWMTVHIFFLIGFRNRVLVFLSWAWAYFKWERGARLITGDRDVPFLVTASNTSTTAGAGAGAAATCADRGGDLPSSPRPGEPPSAKPDTSAAPPVGPAASAPEVNREHS